MAYFLSKQWSARMLRISLLLIVGYLLLRQFGLAPAFGADDWKTNFEKRTVELSEIRSGGPPKDGIPAIDKPNFVNPQAASEWLHAQEPVIAVEYNGDARAYPLQILIWHEIVNDEVGGKPISVTFCPLCNASIVYDRNHQGKVLDFGTTGRLRKSDMVMYDRQTETWWQQFSGEGIVGELAGTLLKQLPTRIIAFADFQSAYPQGKVLSKDTGYFRNYGRNPYRGYDTIGNFPFLLDEKVDPRLPAMERVLAVSHQDKHRLYPFRSLEKQSVVNDRFGALQIAIFAKPGTFSVLDAETIIEGRKVPSANAYNRRLDDRVLNFEFVDNEILDVQTGSTWNLLGESTAGNLRGKKLEPLDGGVHFAFAWLAFTPDSEIYSGD